MSTPTTVPHLPWLVDSHCHLEPKDFSCPGSAEGAPPVDVRPEVIARAWDAGVRRLVCIGSGGSLDEVRNAVALAERHPHIWAAIGIHPHDAARVPAGALEEIERLVLSHPRVVAVGETGLDHHYDHSPREEQRELFRFFVRLARRAGKPLTLHVREAHEEALGLLVEERADEIGGVVHCFTGGRAEAERYVGLGFHVSLSGIVTFKSAKAIQEAAAWLPADRLLIETDCPYLAPIPHRGRRNEPAYLVHTASFLAQLRGVPVEVLAREAWDNTARLFRLPEESVDTPGLRG